MAEKKPRNRQRSRKSTKPVVDPRLLANKIVRAREDGHGWEAIAVQFQVTTEEAIRIFDQTLASVTVENVDRFRYEEQIRLDLLWRKLVERIDQGGLEVAELTELVQQAMEVSQERQKLLGVHLELSDQLPAYIPHTGASMPLAGPQGALVAGGDKDQFVGALDAAAEVVRNQ